MLDLFDALVDGGEAARLGLPGKPDPALFLEAARRLGVPADAAAVVEDALAGVEAGRRGGFGLVVGVDRPGPAGGGDCAPHGADVVVSDLAELLRHRRGCREDRDARLDLGLRRLRPGAERLRESLCTLGNGYFATRGAAPECAADDVHYPGTYAAGCYNRLTSHGRRPPGRERGPGQPARTGCRCASARPRAATWLTPDDRDAARPPPGPGPAPRALLQRARCATRTTTAARLAVRQLRLVHMADPHLAALRTAFTAENWSGRLEVESALDGDGHQRRRRRYRRPGGRHLTARAHRHRRRRTRVWLRCRDQHLATSGSPWRPAPRPDAPGRRDRRPHERPRAVAASGLPLDRRAAPSPSTRRSRCTPPATRPSATRCDAAVDRRGARPRTSTTLLATHTAGLGQLWRRAGLDVPGERRPRSCACTSSTCCRPSPRTPPTSTSACPARGLHGEAYRGHVFWDELFVLPYLNLHFPEVSRALLRYRHRRLDAGPPRGRATPAGAGAMYPWQSGSDGREETQQLHLNPRSGRWLPDHSRLQHHVGSADRLQRLAVLRGHRRHGVPAHQGRRDAAGDRPLLGRRRRLRRRPRAATGSAASSAPTSTTTPTRTPTEPGLDDNAYTNVMAAWVLARALDVLRAPARTAGAGARSSAPASTGGELDRWEDVSRAAARALPRRRHQPVRGLRRPRRARLGRLPRRATATSAASTGSWRPRATRVNRYQASKQADVLMLGYLFSPAELARPLRAARLPARRRHLAAHRRLLPAAAPATARRSAASSTPGCWPGRDRAEAWTYCQEALRGDIADLQGGTTGEGIHLGAMAGTLDLVQRGLTGLETRGRAVARPGAAARTVRRTDSPSATRGTGASGCAWSTVALNIAVPPVRPLTDRHPAAGPRGLGGAPGNPPRSSCPRSSARTWTVRQPTGRST